MLRSLEVRLGAVAVRLDLVEGRPFRLDRVQLAVYRQLRLALGILEPMFGEVGYYVHVSAFLSSENFIIRSLSPVGQFHAGRCSRPELVHATFTSFRDLPAQLTAFFESATPAPTASFGTALKKYAQQYEGARLPRVCRWVRARTARIFRSLDAEFPVRTMTLYGERT